jgi:dTDP-glucose pyrophosphorylase
MNAWKDSVLLDDSTVREVIENLNKTGLRIVLVINRELGFVGVVVDGDIRRGMLRGVTLDDCVLNIVNRNPEVIAFNSSRSDALSLMTQHGVSHLPVVDADQKLCGLYSLVENEKVTKKQNLVVIMAGGFGRRLLPHTESIAKPMVKVGDKPILEYLIENVRSCGFEKILIAVRYMAHSVEEYFGNGKGFGVQIEYLREKEPLGTAGALSLIDKSISSPILVSNADLLSTIDFSALLDFHVSNGSDATMAVRNHELENPFGVVEIDGGNVVTIIEKPKVVSKVSSGVYAINPSILRLLNHNENLDMPELLNRAISRSLKIGAFLVHEDWVDIANESDLRAARAKIEPRGNNEE